jgi:dihydrofolate reductase
MKVTLIAAITTDGFIGRDALHVSTAWTSKEDKAFFISKTKELGTVVMGSTTYETFNRPFKDRRHIVLSRTKTYEGVETTSESPSELIKRLTQEGVETLALCGGSAIYTTFLEQNYVDKVYLTVEGILFGSGIKLLSKELEIKMKLVSTTTLGENTILLEYDILK